MDHFRKEYTPLSEEQKAQVIKVKDLATQLLLAMGENSTLERSEKTRCHALAKTNLEQSVMWAVKGITTKQE